MSTNRLQSRRRKEQGSKWARVVIGILATIGVIDTGSITINQWGWIGPIACPGGESGCNQVINSAWGTVYENAGISIPLSMIGFLCYFSILSMAILPLLPIFSENKINLLRNTWWGLFYFSCAMAIFSLLLVGIMVFKIKAFCLFCLISAIISILLLFISIIWGGWEDRRDLFFKGIILSLVIILSGLVWSTAVDPDNTKATSTIQGIPPAVKSISNPSKIALAEHLTKSGVVMYNAYWCPHCHDQKEIFGQEATLRLVLVECAEDGQNSQRKLCETKGITGFPSWELNGNIESGMKSLEELANSTNYLGPRDF